MEEKTTHSCKNCASESEGQFCAFCGQRYHAHKESFGELVYEFASDFLHFDSRFFKTVLPLLFSPGKLTKSYNEGRQRSQFHPIRLYLFSSFVYFFLFFYFNNVEEPFENKNHSSNQAAVVNDSIRVGQMADSLIRALNIAGDSTVNKMLTDTSGQKTGFGNKKYIALQDPGGQLAITVTSYIDSLLKKNVTPEEYVKQQHSMSREKRAGYFERIITQRLLKINLEGEAGKKEFFKKLFTTFAHNIPKMLFFLLPVFALLLKLLYIRRKQFYFVDHAVLSLHYFSFIFLVLILSNYVLDKILGTDIFTFLSVIWISLYMLIAMKRLYLQSWKKTIVKFLALGILFFFTILITLIINLAWSALMI